MELQFKIRVQHEGEGLWAEVLDLPGCFATGDDLEELRDALTEAISFTLGIPLKGAKSHLKPGAPPAGEARDGTMSISA